MLLLSTAFAAPFALSPDRSLEPDQVAWTLAGPLGAAVRVSVVEDLGDRVEVRANGRTAWVDRVDLTPMGREADLDGDGVVEQIVVGLVGEGVMLTLREGEQIRRVELFDQPIWRAEWSLADGMLTVRRAGDPSERELSVRVGYADDRLMRISPELTRATCVLSDDALLCG
jgi:hypothetical protein